MMRFYKTNQSLKNTELINEITLNLPIHPDLSDNDVDHIITSIKEINK